MDLANLLEYLRPGPSQTLVKASGCAMDGQSNQWLKVEPADDIEPDHVEADRQHHPLHSGLHLLDLVMQPVVHQEDRSYEVDRTSEDDRSMGESGSKDGDRYTRQVIDIFQPASDVVERCDSDGEDGDGDEYDTEPDSDEEDEGWYPFGGLLHLVSILLMGYMHTMLSRLQYEKVSSLMELLGAKLHHLSSVWRNKRKLRDILNMQPQKRESVFQNQCYSLSVKRILALELANPYVNPHLDFYPVDSGGKQIFKLSQSFKWREALPRQYRAQMVAINKKHYYIYEPCQLQSGSLVVPTFFYEQSGKMYAKCVKPKKEGLPHQANFKLTIPQNLPYKSSKLLSIDCDEFALPYLEICMWGDKPLSAVCHNKLWEDNKGSFSAIQLPNKWRENSGGRIIRHVPIALYCDDTSGNQSKKWNKHISYYFTLAGLPPKLSNQQYNCHFLSTSNTAGPLELADQIVDELNEPSLEGSVGRRAKGQESI